MSNIEIAGQIDRELHDLCQPLSRLSCYLELGQMMGDPEALRESVSNSMVECRNIAAGVARMRQRICEMAVSSVRP